MINLSGCQRIFAEAAVLALDSGTPEHQGRPARETAATSRGEVAEPMPPSAIGCSISSNRKIGARTMDVLGVAALIGPRGTNRSHSCGRNEICEFAFFEMLIKSPTLDLSHHFFEL
jgi:hypothetical protein